MSLLGVEQLKSQKVQDLPYLKGESEPKDLDSASFFEELEEDEDKYLDERMLDKWDADNEITR